MISMSDGFIKDEKNYISSSLFTDLSVDGVLFYLITQ